MDDELRNFEAELRELTPVAPSRALLARIAANLARDEAEAGFARSWWLWGATLPVAAALAFMAGIAMKRDTLTERKPPSAIAAETGEVLTPVAAENIVYAARDEGLVTLGDGTPARRARLNSVDTFTWENPRTKASLKWSVPREEVRVIPVAFQ